MAGQSSENSNPVSQAVSNSHQRSTSAGGMKIESGQVSIQQPTQPIKPPILKQKTSELV